MPKVIEKERKTIFETDHIDIEEIKLGLASGKETTWYAAKRKFKEAVVVVPLTYKNEVVLIRQFRPPMGGYVWEFPAGIVDGEESCVEAARRELKEETGLDGKTIRVSPRVPTSPGFSNECIRYVFMNVAGVPTTCFNEENEDITVKTIRIDGLDIFLELIEDPIDAKCWAIIQYLMANKGEKT
jgi:ADP-ribose pyrophosphatase